MSELLEFTIDLARLAGGILREKYVQPREIYAKGLRDIYTDADLAAQTAIVGQIRARDPQAAILAEENIQPPDGATSLWVIDPLDGTTNYARHIPVFSTSIALVRDGRPVLGVIYDPLREDLFAAEIDQGATLNGQPIHVSAASEIGEAVIGLDWGKGEDARARELAWLQRTGLKSRTIRTIGSAALGLCYLAAGWIDVYYHGVLMPWDGAAGKIIIEEAGGQVLNHRGQPWNYVEPDCIACNPKLLPWARASLG
jgi:myo-inositol-1(or 4)-monophosphatase